MSKPHLYKRLSKYNVSKVILEYKELSEKQVEEILKQRQYSMKDDFWDNGFVQVRLLKNCIQISHSIIKNSEGVKCFYEKDLFVEFLRYFEYKMKR